MGWDRKRRGPGGGYFYLAVRTPAGVKKVYFGCRTAGHLAAAAVEQRRQARIKAASAVKAERAATADADRLADELAVWADLLTAAWLVLTGHAYHRGEWRRPMGKKKQPSTGDAPKKKRHGTVENAREMVKMLTIHANQGHPEAVGSIEKWLEVFPELKPECRALDELAEKAEAAWAASVGFGDKLAEQAARDEATKLKQELTGDSPSLLDRVLASTVVIAHMAHTRAAIMAAQKADHPGIREARERVLSAAQKRLAAAVKAHRLLARKKGKGMKPKAKLKVFEPSAA